MILKSLPFGFELVHQLSGIEGLTCSLVFIFYSPEKAKPLCTEKELGYRVVTSQAGSLDPEKVNVMWTFHFDNNIM